MNTDDSKPLDAGEAFAAAWATEGEERQAKLVEASEKLRREMEALSDRVASLIVKQPPLDLLGYLWSRFFIDVSAHAHASGSDEPDRELIQTNQFAMEYVHAVLSGIPAPKKTRKQLKVEEVTAMFAALDELMAKTMQYVMASSMVSPNTEFGSSSRDVEFQAKSTWVLIRGHRYQVLEEEFFNFVLAPHNDVLMQAYGIGATEIASGMQAIVTSIYALWGNDQSLAAYQAVPIAAGRSLIRKRAEYRIFRSGRLARHSNEDAACANSTADQAKR